ncbi:hypothetical protein [Streptomyces olivaceiscleroticus]|uniref:Uncharacterized protein n=1 Tax=Streptomyces olivaceiscleroticus TaxID=68245 RepID=A0ABN1BLX7_9ACTN
MCTCPAGPALRTAEDELGTLRRRHAAAVTIVHNPAYDLGLRQALARAIRVPEPTK